jgi:hypothetical protein
MEPWKAAFSVGEVRWFSVRRDPFTHKDGTRFPFLLVVELHDGREFPIRMQTILHIAQMALEFRPEGVQAPDGDLATAKEIASAIAAVAQCKREIARAFAEVGVNPGEELH